MNDTAPEDANDKGQPSERASGSSAAGLMSLAGGGGMVDCFLPPPDVPTGPAIRDRIWNNLTAGATSVAGDVEAGTRSAFNFADRHTSGWLNRGVRSVGGYVLRQEDSVRTYLGSMNISAAAAYVQDHANRIPHLNRSGRETLYTGYCAQYVREALQAGGVDLSDHPGDAAHYIGYLDHKGFQRQDPGTWVPQVGDVVVFKPAPGHENGHICMYTNNGWFSDAPQGDSPFAAEIYRERGASGFVVYRHEGAPTTVAANNASNQRNNGGGHTNTVGTKPQKIGSATPAANLLHPSPFSGSHTG